MKIQDFLPPENAPDTLGTAWDKLDQTFDPYILKLYNAVQNNSGVTLTPLETQILYTIINGMIKTTKAISNMDFVIPPKE